jgi:hypothetical protein
MINKWLESVRKVAVLLSFQVVLFVWEDCEKSRKASEQSEAQAKSSAEVMLVCILKDSIFKYGELA